MTRSGMAEAVRYSLTDRRYSC